MQNDANKDFLLLVMIYGVNQWFCVDPNPNPCALRRQTQAVHHRLHMFVQQAEEGVTCRRHPVNRGLPVRARSNSTVIMA